MFEGYHVITRNAIPLLAGSGAFAAVIMAFSLLFGMNLLAISCALVVCALLMFVALLEIAVSAFEIYLLVSLKRRGHINGNFVGDVLVELFALVLFGIAFAADVATFMILLGAVV